MKEFRPQQLANRPIFLIAFTLLGAGYTVWLVYDYIVLKSPVNWYAIAFVLGVIALQWYSRLAKSYFVRLKDDRIEWKNSTKPKAILLTVEIKEIVEQSYGVDFLVEKDWKELSLDIFSSQQEQRTIVEEVKKWAESHSIPFEPKG